MSKKYLFAIFIVVFIDLLGFSLILPLLPFYAESFGASPLLIGLLVAVYALMQLIGAPVLGRLSDRFGRRPILLISIFGNIIGFILLGFSNSLWMLFLARGLSGLTGGNISVAQAYITDVTDEKNRARGLGIIGAAFGLGFIIGPAVGGILSQWGFAVPAFLAAGAGLLNLLLVIFWLPESLTVERRKLMSQSLLRRPPFTARALWEALRRPFVGPLLTTRFFFGFAFSMFQTIFALYGQYRFGLNSQTTGYVLGYVGVLSVIVQGFLIGKLSARYPDRYLIFSATVLMAISLIGWAFAPNLVFLLIVLAPIALAGGVLNTVLNSALSKSVAQVEVGGTLGLGAALESLTRVIAPSLGGWILGRLGTSAPGILSAVILICLSIYIWQRVVKSQPVLKVVPESLLAEGMNE